MGWVCLQIFRYNPECIFLIYFSLVRYRNFKKCEAGFQNGEAGCMLPLVNGIIAD